MAVSVVNQWSGTFTQPASFGPMPPALQSLPLALTVANSVGGGSGTPTQGNWLMVMTGMSETSASAGLTVAVSDDIGSYWRVPKVSTSAALTRAAVWYTANTARAAGYIYVAPNGMFNALTVLVLEISGLGPWDTVTGTTSNYASAATSLSMSLGAPAAASAVFGMVAGDLSTATQAFAPGGWTTLSTTSVTNGSDHLHDSVLTAAYLPSTSGSVSVSGTAVTAEDLSGVLVELQISAPSPIPASQNPAWPYMRLEAAFGSGFQTPPDQQTWTDITSRGWAWDEQTGVQYQLGQLQATNANLELDNFDGALSVDNPGSPYYSNALNSNMSFQSGVSPWTPLNATLAQSSAHVFATAPAANPQFSLQVTPTGGTTAVATSELVPVSPSTAYSASAWFYSVAGWNGAGDGGQVGIFWFDNTRTFISASGGSTVPIPAATWTQAVDLNITSPANAAFGQVIAQFVNTPVAAFFVAEAALVAGAAAVTTGLVTTGVPIRLRAAAGTLGGVTSNRWYVIQRNIQEWPQKITETLRRYSPATATDIWSALSATDPTPYRGEVYQDNPYAWWPCDDQPLDGGVLPTTLRNAAPGNTNALTIQASPNGVSSQDMYSYNFAGTAGAAGTDITTTAGAPPGVAVYAVGQQQGWMYGDPQSGVATFNEASGPVTASPGSAAWQVSGALGNTGAHGWFLTCNDSAFPPLSGGTTVEVWSEWPFAGSAQGYAGTQPYGGASQPYSALTILELATASAPVAELQMDLNGNLSLITYNGATPTSNSVYTSSDLRNAEFFHAVVELTATTWTVYINGGLTATVSGSATGMTSAWNWLILNGDLGASGGSTLSAIQHGGNAAYSHVAVYPGLLSQTRVLAHYVAAVTGFGLIPAPQTLQLSTVGVSPPTQFTPDGTAFDGSYGVSGGAKAPFSFSALAVAQAGSYTSGPSARVIIAAIGPGGSPAIGDAVWVSWTSLSPSVAVYTSAAANAETNAATCCGSGDSFTAGFGGTATGRGRCQTAAGTGSSPPSGPTSLGDTVQQRIERILGYANATYPGRSIDPASLMVQAATDIGGQQASQNAENITLSDGGLLFINNLGNLVYWQRTHLAAQYSSPAWVFTPGGTGSQYPYYRDINWLADPQRVWNAIAITPFSPEGATLALITPQSAAAVKASQQQYGAQPQQFTSYLQSTTEMQNQANWLFTEFGTIRIRIENLKTDASAYPAAWQLVLGANVGDIISAQNWQLGNVGPTGTFRISHIDRRIHFAGQDGEVEGIIEITADFEPSTYWS